MKQNKIILKTILSLFFLANNAIALEHTNTETIENLGYRLSIFPQKAETYSGSANDERDSLIFTELPLLANPPQANSGTPFQSLITADADTPPFDRFRIGGAWYDQIPDKILIFMYEDESVRNKNKPIIIKSIDIDIDGKVKTLFSSLNKLNIFVAEIPINTLENMNKSNHCIIIVKTQREKYRINYTVPQTVNGELTAIVAAKNFLKYIKEKNNLSSLIHK